jgi:hypothetical protein
MKIGVATVFTDEDERPGAPANALEDSRFDALVVGDHSRVPTSRVTLFPARGDVPRGRETVCRTVSGGRSCDLESDTLRLLDRIAALVETCG